MTTNNESTKLGWPGKIIIGIFLVLMVPLGFYAGASAANAAPVVTLKSGDMINDASLLGFLPAGAVMVVAGQDGRTGKDVAITVGHGVGKGSPVNKDWLTPIGRGKATTFTVTGAQQVNQIDVAVVELNSNVHVIKSGHRVAAPKLNERLTKRGFGLWTPHVDGGRVSHIYETDFRMQMPASPFDSGGIVTNASGDIVGIVSRGFKDYTSPDTVIMRFDKVLEFIDATYGIKLVNY